MNPRSAISTRNVRLSLSRSPLISLASLASRVLVLVLVLASFAFAFAADFLPLLSSPRLLHALHAVFEIDEDPTQKSFFSEIISRFALAGWPTHALTLLLVPSCSISDAKFTADGRYILSRDYLTLKIWGASHVLVLISF